MFRQQHKIITQRASGFPISTNFSRVYPRRITNITGSYINCRETDCQLPSILHPSRQFSLLRAGGTKLDKKLTRQCYNLLSNLWGSLVSEWGGGNIKKSFQFRTEQFLKLFLTPLPESAAHIDFPLAAPS